MSKDGNQKPGAEPGTGKPTAVSASPRAKTEGIDFSYFLWLATVATAILASVSMLMAGGLLLLNYVFELVFSAPLVGGANYTGIMRVTGVFACMSVLAHALRLRMAAVANSTQAIPFPDEIVATPNTGDPAVDKFECVGRVLIFVRDTEIADIILANRSQIAEALSGALSLAISDPVVRYSKERIEHTLRMGLGNLLPLKSVSAIGLTELRHRPRSSR
ncbi:hypothetical protein [Nisaea sp.]|uniref:hypothetical protein n=1 Tax=Nisaea sp. TaxID=2024842 RepID=UPI0032EB9D41